MRKFTTLFALLLFIVSQDAFAQRTITGKVINAEDGLGMPGVSVVVKGTTTGIATDAAGNFSLIVPNNRAIIVVSFIGFKMVEIQVGSNTQFTFTLQPDAVVLGDVVVTARRIPPPEKVETALGIQRDKKTLPYAVQTISGDELRKAGDQNFMVALRGKVAGLNVGTSNSGPGSSTFVNIRGAKSFGGSSSPLFVLDGIPITNNRISSANYDYGDGLSQINIYDIESVTVLPSANATILYGSAGAAGVIAITTKKIRTVSQSSSTQQNVSGQRTIMGKVISEKDGIGMARVPVIVKGTTIATTTDREGNFFLKVPNDAIIEVSFTGFKTVEMPIENKTWYEITLQPEINVLGNNEEPKKIKNFNIYIYSTYT